MRAGHGAQCGVLARNCKGLLPESSVLPGVLFGDGETAQDQWHRFREQARMQQQAHLLILGEHPLHRPSLSHWFQASVSKSPDWLSLSASSISRLSGRLQFVPHVLVASEDGGRALRGRQGTLAVY